MDKLDFSRLCYVPYGFMMANIETHQFNQPFHHACWRIFCETRLHQLLYEKNSPLGAGNVVAAGFPKFETLWERREERFWPTNAAAGDVKVIWAPHHSLSRQWLGFSTFVENHMQFLRLAHDNPNLHIVLRPHPALFPRLLPHGVPQEDIDRFITYFTSLPNAALYEEGDFSPLFNASDLLIADGVGIFSEYMLTGKPIIYTDSGRSVGFNEAGNMLLGGMYRACSFEEVTAHLDQLLSGNDPLRDSRESIAKMRFDPSKTLPSQRVLEILKSSCDK